MKFTFKEIAVKGTRRWKDEGGKKHQLTKTFFQTINPFNKNAAGEVKSEAEIYDEIRNERDEWLKGDAE